VEKWIARHRKLIASTVGAVLAILGLVATGVTGLPLAIAGITLTAQVFHVYDAPNEV
jgi:uncharacterized membrane protein